MQYTIRGQVPRTLAMPGQILTPVDVKTAISAADQTKLRLGVRKLNCLMKWLRPEISYAVRELSKHMKMTNPVHVVALRWLFKHLLGTKE